MRSSLRAGGAVLGLFLVMALTGCQSPPSGNAATSAVATESENPMANLLDALPSESEWALTSASSAGLDRPEAQAVRLRVAPTRISGTSGCNQFSAGYQIVDKRLAIGPPAATKMGCPGAVGAIEQALFALLPQLSSASMEGSELVLRSEAGETLRFAPAEAANN